MVSLFQVHTDVWKPSLRDSRPEGDLQVHKRSAVQPALQPSPRCSEAHLKHPAKEPQRQTHPGPNPEPRVLHQSMQSPW